MGPSKESRAFFLPAVAVVAIMLVMGCEKKEAEVLPDTSMPSGLVGDIKVDGLPKTVANDTSLTLTVSGSGVTHYMYSYAAGATSCNNAKVQRVD